MLQAMRRILLSSQLFKAYKNKSFVLTLVTIRAIVILVRGNVVMVRTFVLVVTLPSTVGLMEPVLMKELNALQRNRDIKIRRPLQISKVEAMLIVVIVADGVG